MKQRNSGRQLADVLVVTASKQPVGQACEASYSYSSNPIEGLDADWLQQTTHIASSN